jgi:hypothetical protein
VDLDPVGKRAVFVCQRRAIGRHEFGNHQIRRQERPLLEALEHGTAMTAPGGRLTAQCGRFQWHEGLPFADYG